MNVTYLNKIRGPVAVLILALGSGSGASGAVSFAAVAGDLLVVIDAPLTFTVSTATVASQFALNFENVYATGSAGHHGEIPISGGSTMTLPSGESAGLETWSDLGMTAGLLDSTDFYATYFFSSPRSLAVGDIVTVSPGTMVIEGFITRGGAVPDSPASSIHLMDESLSDLSGPQLVPEAPVALLGGLGLLGLLRRRR